MGQQKNVSVAPVRMRIYFYTALQLCCIFVSANWA